jgi:hypothetical protein
VGWDNQSMDILSLRHGSPHVTASGKTLGYIPNIRYLRQPDRVTAWKGKYDSFVGK